MTVAGTARILQLPAQPAQPVLQQRNGLLPLCGGHGGVGRIGGIQQLHQGGRQLFGGAPLRLALECMPLAIVDGEQSMQDLRCFSAAFWPLLMG
ncbi:MAG: hypothetical protein RLZZ255_1649 [Cyanobacteriota bacterium]